MAETLDRGFLKNHLEDKKKHDVGKVVDVLPFLSKRTRAVRDNFNKVLGEYVRNINSLQLTNKEIQGAQMAEHVNFKEFVAEHDFKRFISQYLFEHEEIKPIHSYLFNYLKVDDKNSNEFKKYAQFMSDTLSQGNQQIKDIFLDKTSDNILTELILSQLEPLKESKRKDQQYELLFPPLIKNYQEDLIFLSKHKEYFLGSFPLLTHFYTFMYAVQVITMFSRFTNGSSDDIKPFYFGLDWEAFSKRRKAADEFEGYKFVREQSKNLFPHIHTISHLSHNALNNERESGNLAFIPYGKLYKMISDKGKEFEDAFLYELKAWIQDYKNLPFTKVTTNDDSSTLPEAFKILFNCLREGTSSGVSEKFGGNIEDLGYNQFTKVRGNLGTVFNLKHDFVLLLTAVCVKDERIPLNQLFAEYEKRGVALDRYSKKEIVKLFDNLNILDKKSDSGDAQYVKPIL
ncbi:DNA phosphorothioation-dependent restriction protein DptG [Metabacillus indicus]|uniref:DNA phosphorothioation-dependent restriction protein DptG n=1 Tax=Metabacillus indicus TaxID=246786 RepID=UPI003983E34E